MPTIADLGRLIKDEYPGEYDDLTDIEVGRLAKEAYPEDYADFTDAVVKWEPPEERPPVTNTRPNLQQILDYYSPKKGRFTSWWQRGKAESRLGLQTVLNAEQMAVIEAGAVLEKSILEGRKSIAEAEVFIKANQYALVEIRIKVKLIEEAADKGQTLDTRQTLITAKGLSNIKIREHERLAEIDLNNKQREAQEAVRLMFIAKHLSEQQLISISQDNINNAIREIDKINYDIELSKPAKERMIASWEEVITTFTEERRGREKRLLETHKPRGLPEAAKSGASSELRLEPESVEQPAKRGRGRPRKSDS
jgi:hypothetical protein